MIGKLIGACSNQDVAGCFFFFTIAMVTTNTTEAAQIPVPSLMHGLIFRLVNVAAVQQHDRLLRLFCAAEQTSIFFWFLLQEKQDLTEVKLEELTRSHFE